MRTCVETRQYPWTTCIIRAYSCRMGKRSARGKAMMFEKRWIDFCHIKKSLFQVTMCVQHYTLLQGVLPSSLPLPLLSSPFLPSLPSLTIPSSGCVAILPSLPSPYPLQVVLPSSLPFPHHTLFRLCCHPPFPSLTIPSSGYVAILPSLPSPYPLQVVLPSSLPLPLLSSPFLPSLTIPSSGYVGTPCI